MEVGHKYKHLEDDTIFEVIKLEEDKVTLEWGDDDYSTTITAPKDSAIFGTLFEKVETSSNHERQILNTVLRKHKASKPVDGDCPGFSTGHGYWQYDAHRKMAYNDFNKVTDYYLQQMFDEAAAQVEGHLVISDAPMVDIGTEDEAEWKATSVYGKRVVISVRRREDNWYDFCLTLFATWAITEPDVS